MRRQGPEKFSEEFRRHAVQLGSDQKKSIPELSLELGVSMTTLRNCSEGEAHECRTRAFARGAGAAADQRERLTP